MSFYSAVSNSRGLTFYPPVPFFESIESFSSLFHGWFALRKLEDAYTGNCIRIRRGSDDAETDIGFEGRHLDLQAIHNFCVGTTGYIVAWYDQAVGLDTTVNHKAQNEFPSVQPIIYTNGDIVRSGPSNAPSIRFFGGKFLEFVVDEGSTSGLDADGRSTSIVCNVLDAVGPVFKGQVKTGETGDAYGLYIDSTTAKIEIQTDEIVYDLQGNGQNDLIVVSTIHRGDNFFESTPADATLEKDSLIINGDYLEVNTPPSGVTVADSSKNYYIGGFSNSFNGYVSEFIFIKSGITSISSPEHLRRVNGNQSLYYQQQDPAALPTIINDVDTIYFVDYGTIDYTENVGAFPTAEYVTRTIQGFNVPVELSFNYDDTTAQLYYRIDNAGVVPTVPTDPYSGLTTIANGATLTFTEPKNLTLACEFPSSVSPVALEIRNVTDSNTLSGTATLNDTNYVIQLNVAQETFSATTDSGLILDGFTTTDTGDLLLLLVAHDDTASTTFNDVIRTDTFGSAGFTKLAEAGTSSQAVHVGIFYKIADGTEDGVNYYISNSSLGSADFVGWGLKIDNANTAEGWLNTFTTDTAFGGVESIAGVEGITGANNNELIFVAYDGGEGTPITTSQWTTSPFDADKQISYPDTGSGSVSAGWDLIKSFDETSTPRIDVTFGSGGISDGVASIRLIINAAVEESTASAPPPTLPTPAPDRIPQTNLYASYDPADEDSYPGTGTSLFDLSGNGNTLTLNGGVESGYNSNGWFNYDGVNDTASVASTTVSGDCSIGAWYKITGDDDSLQMITGTLGSALVGMQVYYNCASTNNRFFARVQDSDGTATAMSIPEASLTISTGTWYYVCASWNNTTHELIHYIFASSGLAGSNSVTSTGIDTTTTSTADIVLGAPTYYAYGDIGEAHIYNEVLSQTQFTTIYNNTKARYGY